MLRKLESVTCIVFLVYIVGLELKSIVMMCADVANSLAKLWGPAGAFLFPASHGVQGLYYPVS